MSSLAQELANVPGQAKAPVLAEVTQASGQGALSPVQAPTQLAAEQQMETLKHLDMLQQAAVETMTDTAKVIGDAAVKGAKMSQSMTVNVEALEDALTSRRQEN